MSATASDRDVALPGVRLRITESGDGPLVVFLHGFPECRHAWRHQIRDVARAGFRAVAPDLRGYGDSGKPSDLMSYRLDVLADDVADLIGALGERTATVVGHDWGAAIAWHAAMHHSNVVERVAVINCPHPKQLGKFMRSPGYWRANWHAPLLSLPILAELAMRAGDFALLRRALVKNGAADADVATFAEAWKKPGALGAMAKYYRAATRRYPGARRPWIKRIEQAALVLWSEREPHFPLELAEPDPALVPRARVVVLPTASHSPQWSMPEDVSRALISSLCGQ